MVLFFLSEEEGYYVVSNIVFDVVSDRRARRRPDAAIRPAVLRPAAAAKNSRFRPGRSTKLAALPWESGLSPGASTFCARLRLP